MRDMTMERPWVKLMSLPPQSNLHISLSLQPPLPRLSDSPLLYLVMYILGDISPVFNIASTIVRHNRQSILRLDSQSEAGNSVVLTNEKAASSASATHSRGPFIQAAFIN